jgi:hypothetical protein
MTSHHAAIGWTRFTRTARPALQAMLESSGGLPCVNGCGRLVLPTDPRSSWHVGHVPGFDAHQRRTPTMSEVGPAHARCNLSAGGRVGAAVTNSRRKHDREQTERRRTW